MILVRLLSEATLCDVPAVVRKKKCSAAQPSHSKNLMLNASHWNMSSFSFFKQAVRTVLSWCLTSLGWLSKTERPEDNGRRDGHSLGNDVQRQSISLDPFLHWFPAITASNADWIFTSHFIFNQHGMQLTTGTEQQENCFYSRTNHLVIKFQHAEWNGGKPRITRKAEKLNPFQVKLYSLHIHHFHFNMYNLVTKTHCSFHAESVQHLNS